MENNNKIIAMAALLVAVIGLGVGFAAFSSTLTINTEAAVNPTNTFRVEFQLDNNGKANWTGLNDTTCFATNSCPSGTNAVAEGTTLSNLNVTFTEPGQTVFYNAEVVNLGEYDAYLNKIEFSKAKPVCTAGEGATDALVQAACEGISIKVVVDDSNTESVTATATNTSINGIRLVKNATADLDPWNGVTVYISYAAGSARADGPFTVDLGTISLTYSTVD